METDGAGIASAKRGVAAQLAGGGVFGPRQWRGVPTGVAANRLGIWTDKEAALVLEKGLLQRPLGLDSVTLAPLTEAAFIPEFLDRFHSRVVAPHFGPLDARTLNTLRYYLERGAGDYAPDVAAAAVRDAVVARARRKLLLADGGDGDVKDEPTADGERGRRTTDADSEGEEDSCEEDEDESEDSEGGDMAGGRDVQTAQARLLSGQLVAALTQRRSATSASGDGAAALPAASPPALQPPAASAPPMESWDALVGELYSGTVECRLQHLGDLPLPPVVVPGSSHPPPPPSSAADVPGAGADAGAGAALRVILHHDGRAAEVEYRAGSLACPPS
jgi:hypothetical protein